MDDVCADDSSSPSSSSSPLRTTTTTTQSQQHSSPLSPHQKFQQQQTFPSPSNNNSPQLQSPAVWSGGVRPAGSAATAAANKPRPKAFLNRKLDLEPREFQSLTVKNLKQQQQDATTTAPAPAPALVAFAPTNSAGCSSTNKQADFGSGVISPSIASQFSAASSNYQVNFARSLQLQQQQFLGGSGSAPSTSPALSSSRKTPSCGFNSSSCTPLSVMCQSPQALQQCPQFNAPSSTQSSATGSPNPLRANAAAAAPATVSAVSPQQQQPADDDSDSGEDEDESSSSSATAWTQQTTFKTGNSGNFAAGLVHPNIYVGSALDAQDAAELVARGIFYVLNVAAECDFSASVLACPRIRTKKLLLRDTVAEDIARAFDEAFAFIDLAVQSNQRVLVHCFYGVSRSPSIVMAYLMRAHAQKDLQEQQQQKQQHEGDVRAAISGQSIEDDHRATRDSPTLFDQLNSKQQSLQQQQQQQQTQSAPSSPASPTAALASMMSQHPIALFGAPAVASFPSVPAQAANVSANNCGGSSINSSATTSPGGFPATMLMHKSESSSTSSSFSSGVSVASTASSASSTRSYYREVLGEVQRVRPEVLPNFAFTCALEAMDTRLGALRVKA